MATTVRTMRKADFVSSCQQNGPTGTRGSGILHNAWQCLGFRGIDRRLDDLEHSRFGADHKPASLLRDLTELPDLANAPLRIEVSRSLRWTPSAGQESG